VIVALIVLALKLLAAILLYAAGPKPE